MTFSWKHSLRLVSLFLVGFYCCETAPKTETSPTYTLVSQEESDFASYWYQGKAELTSYDLEQARYGEIHSGHAVLIFVTEDFSERKQVKLDRPSQAGKDAVKVMKCNFTKKFLTGIYPYSMMASTFSPIEIEQHPHALKVSTSSQEWCGHSYLQLNATSKGYKGQGNSYFESEGDQEFSLPKVWLEDELWNYIRINPQSLPTGKLSIIPGTFFSRLSHIPLKEETAEGTLGPASGKEGLMEYRLSYPSLNRELRISFRQDFPHTIEGWTETQSRGGRSLSTKATLKKRVQSAYWTQNGANERRYREALGLASGTLD